MKPHIKVIQRNGVDIFVTSSITLKDTRLELESNRLLYAHIDKELEISSALNRQCMKRLNPMYNPMHKSIKSPN